MIMIPHLCPGQPYGRPRETITWPAYFHLLLTNHYTRAYYDLIHSFIHSFIYIYIYIYMYIYIYIYIYVYIYIYIYMYIYIYIYVYIYIYIYIQKILVCAPNLAEFDMRFRLDRAIKDLINWSTSDTFNFMSLNSMLVDMVTNINLALGRASAVP